MHKKGIVKVIKGSEKRILFFILVSAVIFIGTWMINAEENEAQEKFINEIVKKEEAKRKAVISEVKKLLEKGTADLEQKKFGDARQKSMEAEKLMKGMDSPYIRLYRKKLQHLQNRITFEEASAMEYQARKAYLENRYQDAITLAQEAAKISPAMEESLQPFIEKCKKWIDAEKYNEETALDTIDPENKIRKEDVDLLLKEAEILYKNQRYSEVKTTLERVLLKDPFNDQATFLLEKVYKKLYKIATMRRYNEVLERRSEVEWKWNQGILPTKSIKPKPTVTMGSSSQSDLYEKMDKIIFDQIQFEDASISSVVPHLSARSKQLDPDGTGVSLILALTPEQIASTPRITMSFDRIPMSETIRYLCQGTDLKFRVEEKAVIIGKESVDPMTTRFFKVRAALISRIAPAATQTESENLVATSASESKYDPDNALSDQITASTSGAKAPSATSEMLKQFFSDRGIPFEEGATIAYDRRAGKLVVKNTPENLRKLENLLREIDIQTPLVLIEAKILEITQTDLEELGFDWVFSDDGNSNPRWSVQDTQKILRSISSSSNNNTNLASSSYKLVDDLALLPNFGDDMDYNIHLTVNAVNRSGRGEVLSAPKVIATSGTPAIIRMVTEEYFPESWTDPEISTGEQGVVSYTPTYPEFGDATDIGIRFEVTPVVSPNNYTVSLHLNPQIISLTGWTTYSYEVDLGGTVQNSQASTSNTIKMPEISRRDVDTNIKVFDGETVVLGGMLRDTSSGRDDKWPVLGQVPLLGRLFSSQFSQSVKVNLLIFVTVRLMNNDGVPVRPNVMRGVPEFNR